ncbi:major facilitator superfamily domain-containing protein [Suillus paluster]|uniref:major facilitator superfamily domain-containing protein n=1 Tax=Suillus paluster TaxID=48578 RepID=UPI001B865C7A|nr:major facilitator superfamily domain-containing protein [Suillus paluster]KAG1731642.1 major facilitator superfamily domain-containing protein [Suillus paluster]
MASELKLQYLSTPGAAPEDAKDDTEAPVVSLDYDPPSSAQEFPEGGWTGWATAFGSFLVQFCGYGYANSFGVYEGIAIHDSDYKTPYLLDFYSQHYLTKETSSAISWIGSLNFFFLTTVGVVSGSLFDRGYFYHLIIAGSLLQSFSLFMLSLAKPDQYYQIFLAQGVGSGIASGLMFVPSATVLAHHFRRKRTVVMSAVAAGSSLGATVHPIMLNKLLNGPTGFSNGVRASAGFISALLLIACLCMRTRLDPPKTPVDYIVVARKCIRDVPFIVMTAATCIFQIGVYYPVFYLQLDSIKHGIGVTLSFYSLVILNVSSSVGRVTAGFIATFTGTPLLTIAATMMCAALNFGMIGLSNSATVVVLGVLYGFFQGLYVAMLGPLMVFLTPDLSELGARMGIAFFVTGFGVLIGPPISGALLTSNYTWWIPALFSGIISLAGGVLYIVTHLLSKRRLRKSHNA